MFLFFLRVIPLYMLLIPVHSSLEPFYIKILLASIFFSFLSPLAFFPPLQTYLGLLHPGEKKLALDYASSSSLLSLAFTAALLEISLCLMFPLYHFLFIPWLLHIRSGHQWACNGQIHWLLSLHLISVTFNIVTILVFIKFSLSPLLPWSFMMALFSNSF